MVKLLANMDSFQVLGDITINEETKARFETFLSLLSSPQPRPNKEKREELRAQEEIRSQTK